MDKLAFAPGYVRTEDGWVKFPPDSALRNSRFDNEAMEHPAKYNLHMMMAIVEYVSQPGDTIMDIFGGTGSLMLAAVEGRNVILLDVEKAYTELQQRSLDKLRDAFPDMAKVMLLTGSNLKLMPLPCDHIITSPPYANIMKRKTKDGTFTKSDMAGDTKLWRALGDKLTQYSQHSDNIGNFNEFYYNQTMERVYKKAFQCLSSGGTMTVVIKDHIKEGERVFFSKWVVQRCKMIGFELVDWFKWDAPGSPFLQIRRAQGFETVREEDIIIFRKP